MSYRLDRKGTLVILIIVLLVLPALPPILKVQDQTGVSAAESTNQAQIIVNPNQGKRGSIIEITLTNQVVQLGSLVTSIKPEGVIVLMRDVSKDGKIGSYGEFHLIPVYQGDVQPDWVEIAKDTWKRSYYVYEAAMEGPNIISCGDLQTPFTVIGNQPTAQPTESSLPTETPLPDNLPPGSDAFVGVLAALSGLKDFLGGNIVVLGGAIFVTGGLAVFLRHFLRSRRSSFTSPVGMAGMFPENPDDGVMVTSDDEGFIEFILRKIQEGGRMKVADPENLPEMLKISEDESFVDTVTKYFGKVLTDAERAAQDVANEIAGRFVRENPAWGSDSELQQKLAQDNKAELLRQVERELVADAGVAAVKAVRAAEKSKNFFNSEKNLPDGRFNIPPDIAPNDLVDRARKIGGGGEGAWEWISNQDWSGPVDSYYDVKLPDGHDIADAAGGTYAKNAAAHKAYRVFREQYGRGPSPDNYADVDVWNSIRENIESGEGE